MLLFFRVAPPRRTVLVSEAENRGDDHTGTSLVTTVLVVPGRDDDSETPAAVARAEAVSDDRCCDGDSGTSLVQLVKTLVEGSTAGGDSRSPLAASAANVLETSRGDDDAGPSLTAPPIIMAVAVGTCSSCGADDSETPHVVETKANFLVDTMRSDGDAAGARSSAARVPSVTTMARRFADSNMPSLAETVSEVRRRGVVAHDSGTPVVAITSVATRSRDDGPTTPLGGPVTAAAARSCGNEGCLSSLESTSTVAVSDSSDDGVFDGDSDSCDSATPPVTAGADETRDVHAPRPMTVTPMRPRWCSPTEPCG